MKNKLKIFGIVFLSLVLMLFLNSLIIGVASSSFPEMNENLFVFLFSLVVYFIVILFNKKINGLHRKNYGFQFKISVVDGILSFGLGALIIVVVLVLSYLFFGIKIEFVGLKNGFEKPLLILLTNCILVGLWEEFYFRGFVFNTFLKNNFGFHASALISSVIFSLIHYQNFEITSWLWAIGIVFIGYILVYIYTYTNSIWSVVFFHFSFNCMSTMMDTPENEIGVYAITNYIEHSKTLSHLLIVCLGLLLGFFLFLTKKEGASNRIKSYIIQIITANKLDKKI